MNRPDFRSTRIRISRRQFSLGSAISLATPGRGLHAAPGSASPLQITSPRPRQVIQRQGFNPATAYDHNPGGLQLGSAHTQIAIKWLDSTPISLEFRLVLLPNCIGQNLDWSPLGEIKSPGEFQFTAQLPAGGWYRLELRANNPSGKILATASVDPVGVGELFLVSGQSYAAGVNDEHLKITDSAARGVLFDWQSNQWHTANDPFPHVDSGGTIWPEFANLLIPLLRVPVGIINVAVGGTASRQWLPGQPLYQRFRDAGLKIRPFRYVLWQQGESDVIENTLIPTYVQNLKSIRTSLAADWGFEPLWFLAKSTIHPTVYNKPVQESQIRQAITELCQSPGFRPGPDTDILNDENRGGLKSRRHFSPIGQRRAALLWFASVWNALNKEPNP